MPRRQAAPQARVPQLLWLGVVAGCGVCAALVIGAGAFWFALAKSREPAAAPDSIVHVEPKSAVVEEPLVMHKANDGGGPVVTQEITRAVSAQPGAPLAEPQVASKRESPSAAKSEPAIAADKSQARKKVDLTVFADCQKIGTDVLFMKYPHEAFARARAEKKLVFMVHLSGNFEDADFT